MIPLLDVRGLTMRFGGLTAVQAVDFALEPGQILSVIGPNGAGKTTVFNAITGVCEPTAGAILVDGREIRRPRDWRVWVAAAVVGLLTGCGLMAFAADVDALWRTVVVLHTGDPGDAFPVGAALADGWDHVGARVRAEREVDRLADLALRRREGAWHVRSTANDEVLESHPDEATARQRLGVLAALVNLAGSGRTIATGGDRWLVRAGDVVHALVPTEAAAREWGAALTGSPEPPPTVEPIGERAVVCRPSGEPLTLHASRAEALAALEALATRAGKLRWRLVTRAWGPALGFAHSRDEAAERREALATAARAGAALAVVPAGSGVACRTPEGVEVATFGSQAEGEAFVARMAAVGGAMVRTRALTWLALFAGIALGAGGTIAVWQRARRTPDLIAHHGLARTFQNIRLFPDMLVVENVLIAMEVRSPVRALAAALRLPAARRADAAALAEAHALLHLVGLDGRADEVARNLPYGDQRRLEIARAIATTPRLLLLDEPTSGMNPQETADLTRLIRELRERFGLTVLLIEHHMKVVMGISDRVVVLDHGAKIAEGAPAEVSADPKVIEAYLGKTDEAIE